LDVRAAQYQVEAAHAQVAQAKAARAPSFALGGSLGLSAVTVGALTDGATVFSGVMASVLLPVFDGGSRVAQLHKQEAALLQANARYEATVLAALTEVENALVALRDDRARMPRLQDAAASANMAAQLARQGFASGLVDFQAVLASQRSALGTQDSEATARAAISADHVRLYKALGGGWQGTDDPVPRGIP
jgi:multidrug efflux system outer membrane protein